ncbi:MAG: MBL fold metallo-hydrolase [Candidatus Aminicenantes bacterium]|nr:MBL fold metallo-hydrolase [Candidatus Aminicenantes bacterium]
MRIEFFGIRGTSPIAPRRGTIYGGHTPSALVRTAAGENLVVDAGTGLLPLEHALSGGTCTTFRPLHILLTHFHFDHVSGLPFFQTLYRKDADLRFYSNGTSDSLRWRLKAFMTGPYFPVEFESSSSRKEYRRVGPRPVDIGGVLVSTCPLNHPQGCGAYRIEENGRSVVFATDTEHYAEGVDARLAAFALGADVLIYDASYTPAEYAAGKKGWGHSTWPAGVELARAAGAGKLILSHLNPDHSDAKIKRLEAAARKVFPRSVFAREGLILRLEK